MAKQEKEKISIIGVFHRISWRTNKEDDDFCFAHLEDGTVIAGQIEDGSLLPGVPYQFHGHWNDHPNGKRFEFDMFVSNEPHSRLGVISYLEKYAPGIGPVKAGQLFDQFQGEAVRVLRTSPEIAARACGITEEKAKVAAEALQKLSKWEDTKIKLSTLFKGRGFSGEAIDVAIEKWGIQAPARIRRDPFCMLVEKIPSAGFDRCYRLYKELGLRFNRLKVLMICLWYSIREKSDHTWFPWEHSEAYLKQHISHSEQVRPKRETAQRKQRPAWIMAIKLGVRGKWLATKTDEDGRKWIAEYQKAYDEKYLAEKLVELIAWAPPQASPIPSDDEPESTISPTAPTSADNRSPTNSQNERQPHPFDDI